MTGICSRRACALAIVVGAVLALAAPRSRACGHCEEDKIAATYDHAVISAARRNGQTVVFAELQGPIGPESRLEDWIRRQVEASTGVLRGTVRVSLEPPALSFACARSVAATVLREVDRKLSRRGLRVRRIEIPSTSGTRSGSNGTRP